MLLFDDLLCEVCCYEWFVWLVGWVYGVGYGVLWWLGCFIDDLVLYGVISVYGCGMIEVVNVLIEVLLVDGCMWVELGVYLIVDLFLFVLYWWGVVIGFDMMWYFVWIVYV